MYKGEVVGEYVLDLVVQNGLIVDTKTMSASRITKRGQCRITSALLAFKLD